MVENTVFNVIGFDSSYGTSERSFFEVRITVTCACGKNTCGFSILKF